MDEKDPKDDIINQLRATLLLRDKTIENLKTLVANQSVTCAELDARVALMQQAHTEAPAEE
jgi:hypothetical protein